MKGFLIDEITYGRERDRDRTQEPLEQLMVRRAGGEVGRRGGQDEWMVRQIPLY